MTHPFDDYLAAQPEPQRSTIAAMAASLRTLLPGATEAMSYGMPAFLVDGTAIAGLAGFTKHCSYFPHSGQVLPGLTAGLAGYDYDAGTLRMPIDAPLPKSLLRTLVVARMRLVEERPDRSGKLREFYDNGFLKQKGAIRNGQMHGPWSWYRRDGSLMRAGRFKDGAQVGTWTTYDRDGGVVKETRFG